ncbi:hypothetical protein V6N12_062847 [Hibiscus sabdariffa]|uniref:Uncharacterized protein n=1 Tax=Hibiscus sabdariffa TaxID=183260 RepID=A0ABR2FA24_9ROSI
MKPIDDTTSPDLVQSEQPQPHESSTYGQWMIVERRQRRGPQKHIDTHVNNLNTPFVVPHFIPLAGDDIGEQSDNGDVPTLIKDASLASKGKGPTL